MKKDTLTVSVGIPTCYGGDSLVSTARTIRKSKGVDRRMPFFVVADRMPLTQHVTSSLKKLHVNVQWNKKEGSQHKKLKQLVDKIKTDIFVYTQDDIIFERDTIQKIVKAFENDPGLTMVSVRRLPLNPLNFFESLMGVMMRISDTIACQWNSGDNYFAASGRCLAFRVPHLKKFRILEGVVNGDTYLYLENSRVGGKFRFIQDATVFIRSPLRLKDQIGPSSRYQFSREELQKYFPFDISEYYKIPKRLVAKAGFHEFINHPISLVGYCFVYLYTRLKRQQKQKIINPLWSVDASTKAALNK